MQDVIKSLNGYSSKEREKFAKSVFGPSDAATEDEIRALEYTREGYKHLFNLLKDNVGEVPGYNKVVNISDEECAEFQSEDKAKIRKDYLNSLISVIWCLYDCALKTGDAFTQGAFNEQSKNLCDFFLRYITFVNPNHDQLGQLGGNFNHPFVYLRVSTHLKGIEGINHYGIDIRFDKDGPARNLLPNKMTHILFIPYDLKNHKFILKPEDDCMYNVGEVARHGVGLVLSQVGASDSEEHQRKERIPKRIISDFDRLIGESGIDQEEQVQHKEEVRKWGIQKIVNLANENEFAVDSPIRQHIEKLKREYKHTDMRFGREIIFSEEELIKLTCNCE